MVRVDNHSHILLADIRDMVAAARANQIDRYSITEHVSQFKAMRDSIKFGGMHGTGRVFGDLREYRAEFSKVDRPALSGMQLRMGLEVDFSPRYEAEMGEFVNQERWDVLLCSVHEMEDGTDIEAPTPNISDSEAHGRWREYLTLEVAALESGFVPFAVLTHPTRMARKARGVTRLPDDMDALLLDLARTAKKRGKALELNGSDLDFAPALVRRVAEACSQAGCSVSLGSDSHYPRDVFRNMDAATALVAEFGLQPV